MQIPSKRPKVSVIMAVFNEEECIKGTIESILNQTFDNFEFIIINDGSTDGTQEILEDYAQKDKRTKIFVNEKNIGPIKSANLGIIRSKGELVARMDAGDICQLDRFEKQVKFLDENKNVYIVGSYHYWIDKEGQVIGAYRFPVTPEQTEKNLFRFGSIAAQPAVMIRKELFEKTGLYNTLYQTSEEYELYARTIKNGWGIANIPEFLISVVRRRKGITEKKIRAIFVNQARIKAVYLPHIFNFQNFVYTLGSLFFILLPADLLRTVVKVSIRHQKIREFF